MHEFDSTIHESDWPSKKGVAITHSESDFDIMATLDLLKRNRARGVRLVRLIGP